VIVAVLAFSPAPSHAKAAPAAAGSSAAATEPQSPDTAYVLLGLALLVLGAVTGLLLDRGSAPLTLKPGVSAFALFYALAQALERGFEILQLLWPTLGRTSDKGKPVSKTAALRKRDTAVAGAINGAHKATADEAARAQELLERIRMNRALLAWTLTSAVAMAASGYLGLRLLAATADGAERVRLFDVVITGLVVGGGTKPLHDLISNLQASKTKKEDAVTGR
jgi:hypothetical protein